MDANLYPDIPSFFTQTKYYYNTYRPGWKVDFLKDIKHEFQTRSYLSEHPEVLEKNSTVAELFKLMCGISEDEKALECAIEDIIFLLQLPEVQTMIGKFLHCGDVLWRDGFMARKLCEKFPEIAKTGIFEELANSGALQKGKFVYWNVDSPYDMLFKQYLIPVEELITGKTSITISKIRGFELLAADSGKTSDPYIEIGQFIAGKWRVYHKTDIIKKNINPKWVYKQPLEIVVDDVSIELVVVVWDWDRIGRNEFMGAAVFDLTILHQIKQVNESHDIQKLKVLQHLTARQYHTKNQLMKQIYKYLGFIEVVFEKA